MHVADSRSVSNTTSTAGCGQPAKASPTLHPEYTQMKEVRTERRVVMRMEKGKAQKILLAQGVIEAGKKWVRGWRMWPRR